MIIKEAILLSDESKLSFPLIPESEREDTAIERSNRDFFEIIKVLDRLKVKDIPITFLLFLSLNIHTGRTLPSLNDVIASISKIETDTLETQVHDYDILTFAATDSAQNEANVPYESLYPLPAFTYGLFGISVLFNQPSRLSTAHYLLSTWSKNSRLIVMPRIRFKGGSIQDDVLEILGKMTTDHCHIQENMLILPGLESLDFATAPDQVFLEAGLPVIRLDS